MSINVRAAGISGAFTAAVLWVICSGAVALGIRFSVATALGTLFHLRMPMTAGGSMPGGSMMPGNSMTTFSVTWGSFAAGLVAWAIIFGVTCALFAAVYNRRTP